MQNLTPEESQLLEQYLHAYQRLVHGKIPANTDARKHFIAVSEGRAVAQTPHERAYMKWKMNEVSRLKDEKKKQGGSDADLALGLEPGQYNYPAEIGGKFDIEFHKNNNWD